MALVPPNESEELMAAISKIDVPIEAKLMSTAALRLPTLDDITALLPEAAVELVGERREVVIYTGWTVADDDETLVPMVDD